MEVTAQIFEALARVMDRLDDISKTREGTDKRTGKKFTYRALDDVINEIKPIFREERIRLKSEVVESWREIVEGKSRQKLLRTTLRIRFSFVAADGSSESHVVEGEAITDGQNGPQMAIKNALKLCLEVMFLIGTGEDPVGATLDGTRDVSIDEALKALEEIDDPEAWSALHYTFEHLHGVEDYQIRSEEVYERKFGKINEAALEEMRKEADE